MYSHLSGKWQGVAKAAIRIMAVCAVVLSSGALQLAPAFAETPPPSAQGIDAFTTYQKQIGGKAQLPTAGSETAVTIPVIVGRAIALVLSLAGIGFFALSLYAGFLWMDARGNDDKISKSKDILKSAVIGIIVVVASYAITSFVLNAVTVQDLSVPSPTAPAAPKNTQGPVTPRGEADGLVPGGDGWSDPETNDESLYQND